jgi:hypothetical protein
MTTTLTENETALRAAVTEHYLETNKPVDAAQLAERLGWAPAKIRRIMADGLAGVSSETEMRASYSKNYRGFQSGAHKVAVYYPTISHLRTLVLEARKPSPVAEGTAFAPDGTIRRVTIPSR